MREEEQEGLVDRRVWSRTFKGSFDGFRPTAKEPRLSKNLIIFFLVRYPWTRNPLLDVLRAITSQSSSLNHLTGIVFLQKERTRGYCQSPKPERIAQKRPVVSRQTALDQLRAFRGPDRWGSIPIEAWVLVATTQE
jgi:hypothetical protein